MFGCEKRQGCARDSHSAADAELLRDVEAHAVRTNSLEFLLRETQHRLGLHATMPPPSLAALLRSSVSSMAPEQSCAAKTS